MVKKGKAGIEKGKKSAHAKGAEVSHTNFWEGECFKKASFLQEEQSYLTTQEIYGLRPYVTDLRMLIASAESGILEILLNLYF